MMQLRPRRSRQQQQQQQQQQDDRRYRPRALAPPDECRAAAAANNNNNSDDDGAKIVAAQPLCVLMARASTDADGERANRRLQLFSAWLMDRYGLVIEDVRCPTAVDRRCQVLADWLLPALEEADRVFFVCDRDPYASPEARLLLVEMERRMKSAQAPVQRNTKMFGITLDDDAVVPKFLRAFAFHWPRERAALCARLLKVVPPPPPPPPPMWHFDLCQSIDLPLGVTQLLSSSSSSSL
jgi:hypothetical protein